MAIGIKLKHNTGEITTGTGDLQLGAAGNLKLKYATFPSADGSNTHVLSTDGAGNLSWISQTGGSTTLSGLTDVTITAAANNDVLQYNGTSWVDVALTTASIAEAGNLYYTDARVDTRFDTRLATKDTGDLSEGSNLYYTDARADARVSAGTGTIATQDANNVNIGGGNIDNTVIGATTPAAGTFATALITGTLYSQNITQTGGLFSSGNVDINGGSIDGVNIGANSVGSGAFTTLSATSNLNVSGSATMGQIISGSTAAFTGGFNASGTSTMSNVDINGGNIDGTVIGSNTAAAITGTTITANSGFVGNLTGGVSGNADTATTATEATNITAVANNSTNETVYPVFVDGATGSQGLETDTGFTYNPSSGILTATAYAGDGSNLTGVVSTLAALTDTTISGTSSGQLLQWNGSAWVNATVSAASAAGSDTHVQFNDGGNIGADAGLTYAKATDTLTAGTFATSGASPSVTAAGAMSITTTASNGDITITPHGSGDIILDGQKWPQADGSANQILKTDGAGQLSWTADAGGIALTDLSVTTAAASGVGTLTYNNSSGVFTFAPADFTSVNIDGGAIDGTVIGATTPAAIEGLQITAHGGFVGNTNGHVTFSGITGNGLTVSGGTSTMSNVDINGGNIDGTAIGVSTQSSGEFTTLNASGLSTLDNTDIQGNLNVYGNISLTGNLQKSGTDLTIATTSNNDDILITPHGSGNIVLDNNTWPNADGSNGQQLYTNGAGTLYWGTGMALGSLSVTTGSASGGGTLSYNNSNGVFTFQPADLSSYLTSTGVLSSHTDVHNAAPNTSDVLTWVASQSRWEPAAPQFTGFFGLSDTAVDTAADSIAFLDSDNSTKRDTIADFLTAIAGTNLTAAGGQLNASGGGGSQDVFKTIAVSGQSDVVADATTDTLTLAAGSNMTITTNAGSDTITFASTGGGGGGGTTYEEFKCNYHTDGSLLAASDLSSGISGVTIDSSAGGDVTVTFTGYTTPPVGIMFYGYGYASNIYVMNTIGSTGTTLRQLPGGGSSGSPTAFGSFSELKIKIREAETGASRSFGTVTHAWIRFVMGA